MLVETRRKAGVTQAELAKRLGRTQPFVSYLERGERRIDVVEFCAIVRALNGDPVQLLAALILTLPDHIEI